MGSEAITARELLKLVLDDEEFASGKGPRTIVGFDALLEKMDKMCDAITQRRSEGDGEGYEDDGQHAEVMAAMNENLTAMRELLEKDTGGPPPAQSKETQTLLTTIAKNTMRRQRSWEFDVQRDRRTGFTEKIIAKPVGE